MIIDGSDDQFTGFIERDLVPAYRVLCTSMRRPSLLVLPLVAIADVEKFSAILDGGELREAYHRPCRDVLNLQDAPDALCPFENVDGECPGYFPEQLFNLSLVVAKNSKGELNCPTLIAWPHFARCAAQLGFSLQADILVLAKDGKAGGKKSQQLAVRERAPSLDIDTQSRTVEGPLLSAKTDADEETRAEMQRLFDTDNRASPFYGASLIYLSRPVTPWVIALRHERRIERGSLWEYGSMTMQAASAERCGGAQSSTLCVAFRSEKLHLYSRDLDRSIQPVLFKAMQQQALKVVNESDGAAIIYLSDALGGTKGTRTGVHEYETEAWSERSRELMESLRMGGQHEVISVCEAETLQPALCAMFEGYCCAQSRRAIFLGGGTYQLGLLTVRKVAEDQLWTVVVDEHEHASIANFSYHTLDEYPH